MAANPPPNSRLAFLLLGVSLAFGFIVAAEKLSKGISQVRNNRSEVTVKGVAIQKIRSDRAEVNAVLRWRGENQAQGRAAILKQKEALLNKLTTQWGLQPEEIKFYPTADERLEPARDNATTVDYSKYSRSKVPEYLIETYFLIKTTKVEKAEQFTLLETNLEDNVQLIQHGASYVVTQVDDSKKELLELAAKDASKRAQIMVAGTGSKVGTLLEASQGVFQILSADREVSMNDYSVDTTSIEKRIRVVVTMKFEIVHE